MLVSGVFLDSRAGVCVRTWSAILGAVQRDSVVSAVLLGRRLSSCQIHRAGHIGGSSIYLLLLVATAVLLLRRGLLVAAAILLLLGSAVAVLWLSGTVVSRIRTRVQASSLRLVMLLGRVLLLRRTISTAAATITRAWIPRHGGFARGCVFLGRYGDVGLVATDRRGFSVLSKS